MHSAAADVDYTSAPDDFSEEAKIARLNEFAQHRDMAEFVNEMITDFDILNVMDSAAEVLMSGMLSYSQGHEVIQKVNLVGGISVTESTSAVTSFLINCLNKLLAFDVERMKLIELVFCLELVESLRGDTHAGPISSSDNPLIKIEFFLHRIIMVQKKNNRNTHSFKIFRPQSCYFDGDDDDDEEYEQTDGLPKDQSSNSEGT